MKVSELCHKHGISDATYYSWKFRFAGMPVSEAWRLRMSGFENNELRRLLADAHLHIAALGKVFMKVCVATYKKTPLSGRFNDFQVFCF